MIANTAKGEQAVAIEGRGDFRLAYSFPAMVLYREAKGQTFFEFGVRMAEEGLLEEEVPWLFWLGLQHFHPDIDEAMGAQLAYEYGVQETILAVVSAINGAFPPKKDGAPGKAPPRKPQVKPGT